MKNRRKLYYERILKKYPASSPISVLAELLSNMEDMATYYRNRTKNIECLLREELKNTKSLKLD